MLTLSSTINLYPRLLVGVPVTREDFFANTRREQLENLSDDEKKIMIWGDEGVNKCKLKPETPNKAFTAYAQYAEWKGSVEGFWEHLLNPKDGRIGLHPHDAFWQNGRDKEHVLHLLLGVMALEVKAERGLQALTLGDLKPLVDQVEDEARLLGIKREAVVCISLQVEQ